MKHFPYSLISAVNGWSDTASLSSAEADAGFKQAVSDYAVELDGLRSRVSQPAWNFFCAGTGEYGLHDARLLSFTVGDGIAYVPDGSLPYRVNRQATEARVEFINYEQTYHHTFRAVGVRKSRVAFEADTFHPQVQFGDLYIHELTAADDNHLELAFLFANGAEIELEFRQLIYRRRRLRRKYELGERYR